MQNNFTNNEAQLTNTTISKTIYIVLAVGLFIPFVGIVALIVAYVNKGDTPTWLNENYRFAIRTFWIGALYLMISYILTFVLIGFITLAITYIWYIVRCAKGFNAVSHHQTPKNINSWLF